MFTILEKAKLDVKSKRGLSLAVKGRLGGWCEMAASSVVARVLSWKSDCEDKTFCVIPEVCNSVRLI
jgi:hypothetical protein